MSKPISRGIGASLAVFALSNAGAAALEPDKIFERVAPSIWVVRTADADGRSLNQGSAVVIAPGKLITNCHVLARARTIQVQQENVSYGATLEFPDTERDLCQLSVRKFFAPAVTLAPMKDLKTGQRVYAIGNPRGLELSISEGIISSLRDVKDGSPLIQTTAAISKGSSGGGLFDAEARLIGITTFYAKDSQNLNFAHPADWILEVPERGKESLARRKSETAAVAAVAATSAPASAFPKQLTGEELVDHFKKVRKVEVNSPIALMSLNFQPGNKFTITYSNNYAPNGIRQEGIYSVRPDANQVCFNLPEYARAGGGIGVGSEWMSDCFRISQTDEKTYSLKALKGDYSFSYSVR